MTSSANKLLMITEDQVIAALEDHDMLDDMETVAEDRLLLHATGLLLKETMWDDETREFDGLTGTPSHFHSLSDKSELHSSRDCCYTTR